MALTQDDIYLAADELRAIATMGLQYAHDEYERDRAERTLAVSLRLKSKLEGTSFEHLLDEFRQDDWRHVSPVHGAECAVFRDGKILLIQRSDNQLWAMPGGLAEVGQTPAETALRELREETGMKGRIIQLLALWDSRLWKSTGTRHLYGHTFLAESHDLPGISNEALASGFFAEDQLPPLSSDHNGRVPLMFKLFRGELPIPYFDRPNP